MTKRLTIAAVLAARTLLAVSLYLDIQPGTSTQADVLRKLGNPVRSVAANLFEHAPQQGTGAIFVQYRDGGVVDRVEVNLANSVKREVIVGAMKLPPEEFRDTSTGKLVDYYGGEFSLALTYAGPDASNGVVKVEYLSRELYEQRVQGMQDAEKRTLLKPAECRDLYDWAQSEQELAKKAKNPERLRVILEIRVLSQRGECGKARSLATEYRKRWSRP